MSLYEQNIQVEKTKKRINQAINQAKQLRKRLTDQLDVSLASLEKSLKKVDTLDDIILDFIIGDVKGIGQDAKLNDIFDRLGKYYEGIKKEYWLLSQTINRRPIGEEMDFNSFTFSELSVSEDDQGIIAITINDIPPHRIHGGIHCYQRWRSMIQYAIKYYYYNEVPVKDKIYAWYEFGFKDFCSDIDNYTIRGINKGISESGLVKNGTMEHFMFGMSVKKSIEPYTKIWIKPCDDKDIELFHEVIIGVK